MSNWQRRLWTLQESIFAKSRDCQLRDGPQHRDDLLVDVKIDVHFNGRFYHRIALMGLVGAISLPELCFRVPPASRFDMAAINLSQRTSNRLSIETVCFAAILALDTVPLQVISSETVGGHKRPT